MTKPTPPCPQQPGPLAASTARIRRASALAALRADPIGVLEHVRDNAGGLRVAATAGAVSATSLIVGLAADVEILAAALAQHYRVEHHGRRPQRGAFSDPTPVTE